ncbi:MAG: DUF1127 domain-containing protein [Burkholderiaceae bacterium]|nr:DUF1127 domain-containing protein [Burkholderiaceae bacterium]
MYDITAPHASPARRLIVALVRVACRAVTYLRVRAELETMDDRTLADLGLDRSDTGRTARRHASAA